MKKVTQNLMWLGMILSLASFAPIGCKSTIPLTDQSSVATSAPATVGHQKIFYTVESAKNAWTDALKRGEATMAQDTEVLRREDDYYKAITKARETLVKWQDKPEAGPYWDAAMKDANSAAAKFVETINTYLADKKAPPVLSKPPMP